MDTWVVSSLLTVVNSVAMNVSVQYLFESVLSILWRVHSGEELLDPACRVYAWLDEVKCQENEIIFDHEELYDRRKMPIDQMKKC